MKPLTAPALFLLFLLPRVACAEQGARAVVMRVDELRSPQLDYEADLRVTVVRPGRENRVSGYHLFVSGRDRSVIKTVSPPAERGRALLMRGSDLWAYLPAVSRPIRLSLRERLAGDVSNADVARANFSGDYEAERMQSETIGGKEYEVFQLTAAGPDVPYARVLLWVERATSRPFQAQFYGASGKLLKTCTYGNFRELGGRVRPTRLVMSDPLIKGQYSVIDYDQMVVHPLPGKIFTEGYLVKLAD